MLLFIINVGHEELQIIKGHTLVYLTPTQYGYLSDTRENQESVIANISAVLSETKVELLPAILASTQKSFKVITHLTGKCYFKM